ncbi:DUF6538 domain-containing protein [Ruegeria sp. HKCCA5014]|uniref:DUF6538 domain-containing protein n=1 Tax=Ruegeria sp. HKCCA5014 TaxID=2682980 RepID=UPI0014886A32|nr:DUF6538 domain-containing protein [Ruegeria sp. HKCCA5014]
MGRFLMPNPTLIKGSYYCRVAVPADLKGKAKGTYVTATINGQIINRKVGTHAKLPLGTSNLKVARQRFPAALAGIEAHWESLRQGPVELNHKQALALAGEVRADFVRILDGNPGDSRMWADVLKLNELARTGRTNELQVDDPSKEHERMEQRFGGLADAILSRHQLRITAASRTKLIGHLHNSMNEAAKINEAKALGDYSDSGDSNKYPAFEIAAPTELVSRARLTFAEVIDKEVQRRASGRGGAPLRERSEKKYRQAVAEFDAARGDDDVLSIDAKQADQWLSDMLETGKLKIKTVRDRFKNVKTVIEWAREQGLGEVFPGKNPLDVVKPPKAEATDSAARTIRLDEAKIILKAARNESKPERRWLPWMCAYSGARIGEVAQLGPDDFFCVGDDWFYRLTSEDDKLIKGGYSIRRVPVHPALIDEGLIGFVEDGRRRGIRRLFPNRSQGNIRDWVRNDLGLTRRELAPNHGWRHLFEDVALIAHMTDAAKLYITGRSRGSSAEGYGKSDAMLPGLAAQMRMVKPYKVD